MGPVLRHATADEDERFDAGNAQVLRGGGPSFRCADRSTARAAQDGDTALHDVADIARAERSEVPFDQSVVAVHHTCGLDPMEVRRTHHCPDGRVHAWGITAGGGKGDVFVLHGAKVGGSA